MIFSSDGRRLVTSLIVVVTTVILLILLVVNLNCIIFTEATVNTTSSHLSQTSTQSTLTHNPNATSNVSNTTPSPSSSSLTTVAPTTTLIAATDTLLALPPEAGLAATAGISDNIITGQSVVSAKIKDSAGGNLTSAGTLVSNNNNVNLLKSQVAANNNLIDNSINHNMNSTSSNSTSANNQDHATVSLQPCPIPDSDKVANSTSLSNSNETARYFDIDYAVNTFQDSMADKNAISLYHYLNGFKELMKFFHSLGSIFLFVTSDLESKIGLLENYRSTEKGTCNPAYLTIQSVVEYETKENLLRDSKRQSGARTILRLHRALEFLSALMMNLSKLDDENETAPAARDAYSNTLARHHPWTIRTIASFAMRTLPHKKSLVESVLGKDKATNNTLTNEKMLVLSNVTDTLFNVVDKYYEENDLKDLP